MTDLLQGGQGAQGLVKPPVVPQAARPKLDPFNPEHAKVIEALAKKYFGDNPPLRDIQQFYDSPQGSKLPTEQRAVLAHVLTSMKNTHEERIAKADVGQFAGGGTESGVRARRDAGMGWGESIAGSIKSELRLYLATATATARAAVPGASMLTDPVSAQNVLANKTEEDAFNQSIKPWADVGGMAAQFYLFHTALTSITKAPAIATMIEQLPQRMRDIGIGITVGGGAMGLTDAFRPDGLPENPHWMDVSAKLGNKIKDVTGLPDRVALGLGGAAFGTVAEVVVQGLMAGVNAARAGSLATHLSTEEQSVFNDLVRGLGVDPATNPSKAKIADALLSLRNKGVPDGIAGKFGDLDGRLQMITDSFIQDGKLEIGSQDARLLASVYRANPGGVSVATNITDPQAAQKVARLLGLDLEFHIIPVKSVAQEVVPKLSQKALDAKANELLAPKPYVTDAPVTQASTVDQWNAWADASPEARRALRSQGYKPPPELEKQLAKNPKWRPADTKIDAETVVEAVPQQYHVIIGRPAVVYDAASTLGSAATRINRTMMAAADQADKMKILKGSKDMFLLSDGGIVRGGFNIDAIAAKLKVAVPKVAGVERADLALQNSSRYIRIGIGDTENVTIELPARITQEQFNKIGRTFDEIGFKQVTVRSSEGIETTLNAPFGSQVQYAISKYVKPIDIKPAINKEMISQFSKHGVFAGQAGVTADGSVVEMIGYRGSLKGMGKRYSVRDMATNQIINVPEGQITILPTTINNETIPSALFTKYLSVEEYSNFARLRRGINEGLGQEITTKKQLEQLATSRGFLVRSIAGGKYDVTYAVSGQPTRANSIVGAVDYIRKNTQQLPDITPPELKALMGTESNIGFIGGSSQPPGFGEPLHINFDSYLEAIANISGKPVNWIRENLTTMRNVMAQVQKDHGIPTLDLFNHLQAQSVARHNFVQSWYTGFGSETLPTGVVPLGQTLKKIGRVEADHELLTAWLETPKGTPDAALLEAKMSPNLLSGAQDLNKWYTALYTRLGIETDFLENYAPHFRALKEQAGNNMESYMKLWSKDRARPVKANEFIADYMREGMVDFYDIHAGRVALKWLEMGATNRYMKEGLGALKELADAVAPRNSDVANVLGVFSQSLRGIENAAGRKKLGQTIASLLKHSAPSLSDARLVELTDKFVDVLTGAVYTSTQGFRFGSALRNASSVITMVLPYVGEKHFIRALGAALTPEGRQMAIKANAIAYKGGSLVGRETLTTTMFGKWDRLVNVSMYMYDKADELTRAVALIAGRYKAMDALEVFATKAVGANEATLNGLKRTLIKDSGMFLSEPTMQNEFLRRAARGVDGADQAADYAGKFLSDVTNFMYGRGMQSKMLRSIPGRLLGQYGSWPMWYVEYLRRIVKVAFTSEYKAEGMKVLVRHAAVNAAVVAAGYEVGIDTWKWATGNSVFYTGGPGISALEGIGTIMQGAGGIVGSDDPENGMRQLKVGVGLLARTTKAYLPFFYAGRDAIRLGEGLYEGDYTQSAAALLATEPTRAERDRQLRDRLFGVADDTHPYGSTAGITDDVLSAAATGSKDSVDLFSPAAMQGIQSSTTADPLSSPPMRRSSIQTTRSATSPASAVTPPGITTSQLIRERRPATSVPVQSKPIPPY